MNVKQYVCYIQEIYGLRDMVHRLKIMDTKEEKSDCSTAESDHLQQYWWCKHHDS